MVGLKPTASSTENMAKFINEHIVKYDICHINVFIYLNNDFKLWKCLANRQIAIVSS